MSPAEAQEVERGGRAHLPSSLVPQWIEQRFPKPCIAVRFLGHSDLAFSWPHNRTGSYFLAEAKNRLRTAPRSDRRQYLLVRDCSTLQIHKRM